MFICKTNRCKLVRMDFKTYLKFWTGNKKDLVTKKTESIFDIDFHLLKTEGFSLVIFDVDDTIDDYLGEIEGRSLQLLKDLQSVGFKVGIFSNSKPKRTKYLTEFFGQLNIYNVNRSDKPNPAGYFEILNHYKISPEETIMIGDKLGTDMFGAYLAGIKMRILVEPFSSVFDGRKAKLLDRLVRDIEKMFKS